MPYGLTGLLDQFDPIAVWVVQSHRRVAAGGQRKLNLVIGYRHPLPARFNVTSAPVRGALADIAPAYVSHTDAQWLPIRNHFGLTAFGINGYMARRAGDRIIGEHDHSDPDDEQHQELYFVHTGRARFEVDGGVIDAPAGTFVSVSDVATKRSAVAQEDGTVVLVIGAEPGAAFEISCAEREELAGAGLSVRPV